MKIEWTKSGISGTLKKTQFQINQTRQFRKIQEDKIATFSSTIVKVT